MRTVEVLANGGEIVAVDPNEETYNFTYAQLMPPDGEHPRYLDIHGEFDGKKCVLCVTRDDARHLLTAVYQLLGSGRA